MREYTHMRTRRRQLTRRSWAAMVLLTLMSAATAGAAEMTAEPVVLHLHEEVYVHGPDVLLGDIADIVSGGVPKLEEVPITRAASAGNAKRVDAGMVKSRLLHAGFNGEELEIRGARSARAVTLHLEVSREMLVADLRRFIMDNMPWDSSEAVVDIDAPLQDIVVPDGDLDIRWSASPTYNYVGNGSFRGEVRVDGEVQRTVAVRANVLSYAPVVVAAASIPRGQIIRERDLTLEPQPRTERRSGMFEDPAEVVGQVARSTIHPGQVLGQRQVQPRRLVQRNRMVNVETRIGGLVVRTTARAMEHGHEGDLVTCRNPDSKEEFTGVVRADGTVVVE